MDRLPLPPSIHIGMQYLIASDRNVPGVKDGVYIGRLDGRKDNLLRFTDLSDSHRTDILEFQIEDFDMLRGRRTMNLVGEHWWFAVPLIACRIKTPMYWFFCPNSDRDVNKMLEGQRIEGIQITDLDEDREVVGWRNLRITDRINGEYML